jgi:hypothetical protein
MAGRSPRNDPETVLAYVVDNFDHRDKLSLAKRLRDRLNLNRDTAYVSQVRQIIGRPLVAREIFVIRALETQINLSYPEYSYGRGIRLGKVAVVKTSSRITRRTTKRAAKKTAKRAAKKTAKRAAKKTAKRAARKTARRAAKGAGRR